MPFPKHEPDPNIPPPKKRVKSAINRLLTVALDLAENVNLGEAQRLQAARLGADIWDKRPRPRRKSDKEKLLISALSGAKGKQKRPSPKTEP
jgi:hypothetical protein